MFNQEKNKEQLLGDAIKQSIASSHEVQEISNFMFKVQSVNGLHFASALCQIFLGTSVVALSLVNSIHPLWLATMMTVFGSITTMIGLCFLYSTFNGSGAFDSILHKAIKRVINSQN